MNFRRKSAPFAKIIGALLLLGLGGCSDADMDLPHVFGGNEVPPEVIAAPRAVTVPPAADPNQDVAWPRLGDVPSKPKDFTPQKTIDATVQQLQSERAEGKEILRQYGPGLSASPNDSR